MFVKIPHHLGQEVNDLEHQDFEEEIGWERVPHKIISYIFYIKHQTSVLSCLMYFYDCRSYSMRYINPARPDCMENMALKLDNFELFNISQIDGDRYRHCREDHLQMLENPYDIIKNGIERLGLNLSDCEMFICNWTKQKIKSEVPRGNSLYKKITSNIEGYFTRLKNYSDLPPKWRLMTQKEIFDYNINLKNIYRPDLKLYTNGTLVTNENPNKDIFSDLKKEPPIYKSKHITKYERMIEDNRPLEAISLKQRVEERDQLVMLHLIFRKLKSMGLEMLVLGQMIPVPKYTVGSLVINFKKYYNYEQPLLIKDIYMYLDLNYSWNIKYLCADLRDIKKGDKVLNLTYYKQKNLGMIDFSYMYDVYDKIQTRDLKFKKLNSLFQGDIAIIERNRKADYCRKHHRHLRDKSNHNRCKKLWCPGPQKFILNKVIPHMPVIKITSISLDRIHSYNCRLYTKRLCGELREPEFLQYVMANRRDNVKIKWQYTRDF